MKNVEQGSATVAGRFMPFSALLGLLIGLALVGAGFGIYGQPLAPEYPLSFEREWGAWLLFLTWAWGLISWGGWLARPLSLTQEQPQLGLSLSCGTALYAVVAYGVASLRISTSAGQILWTGITLGGWAVGGGRIFAVGRDLLELRRSLSLHPMRPAQILAWAVGSLAALLLTLEAWLPHSFWDSLWYHLTAPRLWAQGQGTGIPWSNLGLLHASYWDALNVWGFWALAQGGQGLVAGHLWGQWTHLGLGLGGVLAVAIAIARDFWGKREPTLPFALVGTLVGLLILWLPSLRYTAILAKNDWGATLWALSGAWLVLTRTGRAAFAGAALLGLGFAAKNTVGAFVLPVMCVALMRVFRDPSSVLGGRSIRALGLMVCVLLAYLPIAIRNFIQAGHWVFPVLSDDLGPTWIAYQRAFEWTSPAHSRAWGKLTDLLRPDAYMGWQAYWVLVIPIAFVWAWRSGRELRVWVGISVTTLTIWTCFYGPKAEARLVGPGLVVAAIIVALGVALWAALALAGAFGVARGTASSLRRRSELFTPILGALGLALLAAGPFRWNAWREISETQSPGMRVLLSTGGKSMLWLREHARAGEVATLADTRLYYLSDLGAKRIWDDRSLDRELAQIAAANPAGHTPTDAQVDEAFTAISRRGFKYLLVTLDPVDGFYDEGWVSAILRAARTRPDRLAYAAERSWVLWIGSLPMPHQE